MICRDASGRPSHACSATEKPPSAQPCTGQGYGDPKCEEKADTATDETAPRWKKSFVQTSAASNGWRKIEGVNLQNAPDSSEEDDDAAVESSASPQQPGETPLPPQRLVDSSPQIPGKEPR